MTDHAAAGGPAAPYSLAFERFVENEDDTVGLIAYALFKSAVRQEAIAGVSGAGGSRAPVAAVVEVYRQAAEQRVAQVIAGAIAQAAPEMQASSTAAAVAVAQEATIAASRAVEGNLKTFIAERTSFKDAILTSFVGWLLTLGVTAIIIFVAGRPTVEERIRKAVALPPEAAAATNETGR